MNGSEVNAHIGRRLRMERRRRNLTQKDVADLCGVSFQQIHKYERGLVRIPASMLWKLAEVLCISAADVFPLIERRAEPGPIAPTVRSEPLRY